MTIYKPRCHYGTLLFTLSQLQFTAIYTLHVYRFTSKSNSYACEMQVKMHDYLAEPVETALSLSQEDAMSFVILNTAFEKGGRGFDLLILS